MEAQAQVDPSWCGVLTASPKLSSTVDGRGRGRRAEQRLDDLWQYLDLALAGFGAFHGLNPGMGWLIALAAGVQERSRIALLRTLPPIAAAHALSILAAAFLVSLLRSVVTTRLVAIGGGAALVTFGLWRAFSHRHDHAFGFRLSDGQLVVWSFLMSSMHGAGTPRSPQSPR
jgi:hypothetical protein